MTYKQPRSSNEDRTARQAEALRANLKRRKAAARKDSGGAPEAAKPAGKP